RDWSSDVCSSDLSSWLFSVSSFAKVISSCSSEALSKTGAKRLHGPHHSAQASTIVMPSPMVVSSKFSLVTSTVAITISSKFQIFCASCTDSTVPKVEVFTQQTLARYPRRVYGKTCKDQGIDSTSMKHGNQNIHR